MSEDNQTQDSITPTETPVSEENPVSPNAPESTPVADSIPLDMPSEAPESPTTEADMSLANNDNLEPTPTESQTPEPSNQPQTTNSNVALATSSSFSFRNLLTKARESIQFRKRKKLGKIMEMLNKKEKISNNDITLLLRVSDATATRYLNILEQEGKIQQDGKTGHSVFYSKI